MRRVLGILSLAAAIALGQEHAPAPAGQEHAQEEAPMPNEIWWKWANFAILAGGLGYLAGKYAAPFFRARTEQIQQGIREAAKVREEAEARAAAIESQIGNLTVEIEGLRANSKEEIAGEGARIQAETEAQIRKLQAQAEREIASTAKNATLDLTDYSAQLAIDLAEKQIRQRLDAGLQDALVSGFVQDLQQEQAGQQPGRSQ